MTPQTLAALADAGLTIDDVQEAHASYVYGDSTCGQVALYAVGATGIPVVNVNNNCASGSTALWQARRAVASGEVDVALAFGFEQMRPGALAGHWDDRTAPSIPHFTKLATTYGIEPDAPMAAMGSPCFTRSPTLTRELPLRMWPNRLNSPFPWSMTT